MERDHIEMAFGKWPYLVQDYFTKGMAGMECKDWINEQHYARDLLLTLASWKKLKTPKLTNPSKKDLVLADCKAENYKFYAIFNNGLDYWVV